SAMMTAALCKDPFGRLLVVGLATIIITQVAINVGMNVGIMPITGMTLPFISAGGSSLVAGFLTVGLIWNVAMRRPPLLWRSSLEDDFVDDQRPDEPARARAPAVQPRCRTAHARAGVPRRRRAVRPFL